MDENNKDIYESSSMNNIGDEPQPVQPAQPAQETQPTQAAQPTAQRARQPQGNAYPNVGSSGMNTANTAANAYEAPHAQGVPVYNGYRAGTQQTDNGYTTSFQANAGNGAYNGYSYTAAPQRPAKAAGKGRAKKVWKTIGGVAAVLALGFCGGLAGVAVAGQMGLMRGNSQVVMQTVQRDDTVATTQGSADGTALSTQDVASIVSPSVVVITTEQMVSSNTWFGNYVESGAGSGVIMSEDGYILTCAHVVDGATSIKVQLAGDDATNYDATVVGADAASDVAVVKIDATGLTPAVMGDSDNLVVGESVLAVGNPMGTLGGTVTNGIISALNREITLQGNKMSLLQTSASISPGNSGGGLFNANGELIGIVNAKSGATNAEGLGFAIPINAAVDVAQNLIDSGFVKRPVLGVTVITVSNSQAALQYGVSALGVYIATVNNGSGAEQAGLKVGDRIVAVGDTVVNKSSDLTDYVQSKAAGDTVSVQVEREGKLMMFDVVLSESNGQ